MGVFASKLTAPLAQVLGNLGATDAMVVHGEDGLDEITITNGTRISRWNGKTVDTFYMNPRMPDSLLQIVKHSAETTGRKTPALHLMS